MTPGEARKPPVSVFVVTTQTDQRERPWLQGVFRTEEAAYAAGAKYVAEELAQEHIAPGKSIGVVRIVVEETPLRGAWGHDDGNNMRHLERDGFVHGLMCALSIVDEKMRDYRAYPFAEREEAVREAILAEIRSITAGGANTATQE